jgi:transketolase C-terminal domain/subunit
MRQIFGQTITRLAEKDKNIVLLTGDVEQEMQEFREKFPERFLI